MTEHIFGYFRKSIDEESEYPFPEPTTEAWDTKYIFLDALKCIEELLEKHNPDQVLLTKGFSLCRLCGDINGSKEFILKLPNGHSVMWPSGYSHYIRVHNVKPPITFINVIFDAYERARYNLFF